jgi:predicted enzyme related to lactoylglutathione lyase
VQVRETFFSIPIADMERAQRFYVGAFDAAVQYASPVWSSLRIAGVRVALDASPADAGLKSGLHPVVADLEVACDAIARAGGVVVRGETEVQPGVVLAEAADPEGNVFTLSLATEH